MHTTAGGVSSGIAHAKLRRGRTRAQSTSPSDQIEGVCTRASEKHKPGDGGGDGDSCHRKATRLYGTSLATVAEVST